MIALAGEEITDYNGFSDVHKEAPTISFNKKPSLEGPR